MIYYIELFSNVQTYFLTSSYFKHIEWVGCGQTFWGPQVIFLSLNRLCGFLEKGLPNLVKPDLSYKLYL